MKTVKISAKQTRLIINSLNSLGLMVRDETLPHRARELIRVTHRTLKDVAHETGICQDLPEDGFQQHKDGDHQWPLDRHQRWEALK